MEKKTDKDDEVEMKSDDRCKIRSPAKIERQKWRRLRWIWQRNTHRETHTDRTTNAAHRRKEDSATQKRCHEERKERAIDEGSWCRLMRRDLEKRQKKSKAHHQHI